MNEFISNIKFEDPWLLLLLLLVPVYIYYLRTQANNKYVAFKISNTSGFKDYVPAKIKWMRLLPVLRITAVVLIIIAIARPQTGFQ
jgi:Ca-activated chloride channel family protein